MAQGVNYIVGVYGDDGEALKAVKSIREAGVKIHEVYSPFPIHGIDEALGYERSRLPKAAFMFGALGFSLALIMQFWMMGYDWPMIIGGKNFASFDLQFLKHQTNFLNSVRMSHKVLDPGVLCLEPEDESVPSLDTCLKRVGIEKEVAHNTIDDALDVVVVLRAKLGHIFKQ